MIKNTSLKKKIGILVFATLSLTSSIGASAEDFDFNVEVMEPEGPPCKGFESVAAWAPSLASNSLTGLPNETVNLRVDIIWTTGQNSECNPLPPTGNVTSSIAISDWESESDCDTFCPADATLGEVSGSTTIPSDATPGTVAGTFTVTWTP